MIRERGLNLKIIKQMVVGVEIILVVVSIEMFFMHNVTDSIFGMIAASLANSWRRELG